MAVAVAKKTAPATFYTHVTGADVWWRVKAPAAQIGAKTALVSNEEVMPTFTEPNRGDKLPWSLVLACPDGTVRRASTVIGWRRLANKRVRYTSVHAEFPSHEGTAIFTRPSVPQAALGEAMRMEGIRTIAETDDNYLADQNLNLLLRQIEMSDRDRRLHAVGFMKQEALIFATHWLRDRYHAELRARFGKKAMPEMYVCRNNIDLANWPDRIESNGPLRVGFMGGSSHVWDVNLAYGAFQVAKGAGATTTMIGYNPADPDPNDHDFIRSKKSQRNVETWGKVVDRHIRWVSPDEYHRAALPLDIGICPLIHNDFTAGKSDVKAIEYTISGAAVVAMNLPIYNNFWVHEQDCLLANSRQELAECVYRLIKDPKLRYELVSAAQERVREERGATQMYQEWMAAIRG